jgi:hypothetical protein
VQGTQFTCFTGNKVQILTQKAASSAHQGVQGTQFTCFTGNKVQILTQKAASSAHQGVQGTQFTCFTGNKVQILTQKAASSAHQGLPQNLLGGLRAGNRTHGRVRLPVLHAGIVP